MGRCQDCRTCAPLEVEKVLLLSPVMLMTLLLCWNMVPFYKRCPICGHPLKYHEKRAGE